MIAKCLMRSLIEFQINLAYKSAGGKSEEFGDELTKASESELIEMANACQGLINAFIANKLMEEIEKNFKDSKDSEAVKMLNKLKN